MSEPKNQPSGAEGQSELTAVVRPDCATCGDDHYILHGCCSGYECGCMGQPVSMTNCPNCNPKGGKEVGEGVSYYAEHVEYIFKEAYRG